MTTRLHFAISVFVASAWAFAAWALLLLTTLPAGVCAGVVWACVFVGIHTLVGAVCKGGVIVQNIEDVAKEADDGRLE